MKKLLQNQYFIIFASATLLIFLWFREGYQLGTAESGLPFNNLQNHESIMRLAWAYPALGNPTSINVASWPTYYFLSTFERVGIPGFMTQAIFFWLLFVVSGIGIYHLIKEFFPNTNKTFLLLGVFFYWFNPFTMVNIWNRFLYTYMVLWAGLPFLFYLFMRGINKKDLKFSVAVSLVSLVFSFAFTSVVSTLLLWGIFVYTLLFYLIFDRDKRVFLFTYIFLTFISFIFLNFWWITQLFSFVSSNMYSATVTNYFSSQGNIITLTSLSERLGQLFFTTRLWHRDFLLSNIASWVNLYKIPLVTAVEFFISSVAIWTFYRYRRKLGVLFFSPLLVISLFLIKGNNAPLGEIFHKLFVNVNALQLFRNPFEKFGLLALISFIPLFTFGFSSIIGKLPKGKISKSIFWIVASQIVLVWGFPFWTSNIFRTGSSSDSDYKVKVPQYYKDADKWLTEKSDGYRFISLPIGKEGVTYNWEKNYSGVELSSTLFNKPNISFSTTVPYFENLTLSLGNTQLTKDLFSFVPYTTSAFVVLRKDLDFQDRGLANPNLIESNLNNWEKEGLVKKLQTFGQLNIYQIDKSWIWPKFYVNDSIITSDINNISLVTLFLDDFPLKKSVVIDSVGQKRTNLSFEKLVISPREAFFQKVTTPTPKQLTDNELLSKLFHAQHLPGSLMYPIIRTKEKLDELTEIDPEGLLLYRIGLLGKRSAEIYKLRKSDSNKKLIYRYETEYKEILTFMTPNIIEAIGNDTSVSNVIRDSLVYQWILLERAGSALTENLDDLLVLWGVKPRFELPVSENPYVVFSFQMPKDGDYALVGNLVDETESLFLDGQKVTDFLGIGKRTFYFHEGLHEIAMEVKREKYIRPVFEVNDEFTTKSDNVYEQTINIPDRPTTYQINFDFRPINGDKFKVQFTQDTNREEIPLFSHIISRDKKSNGWRNWNQEFTTTAGAKSGILKIGSVSAPVCQRKWVLLNICNEENLGYEFELRNFRIEEIKTPEAYLVMNNNNKFSQSTTKVDWQQVNPTFYKLHLSKNSNIPEVLVFSESFNSGWKVYYENGTEVSSGKHLLVNAYANGWVLDKAGIYDLSVRFYPQEILDRSKNISLASLILSGIFLLYFTVSKKHEKNI